MGIKCTVELCRLKGIFFGGGIEAKQICGKWGAISTMQKTTKLQCSGILLFKRSENCCRRLCNNAVGRGKTLQWAILALGSYPDLRLKQSGKATVMKQQSAMHVPHILPQNPVTRASQWQNPRSCLDEDRTYGIRLPILMVHDHF